MNNAYGIVTKEIVDELKAIVGAANLLTDLERIENYSHDETSKEEYAHTPEVVLTPVSAGQIASIMKLATRYRIPVTPRGAGSEIGRASCRERVSRCV